MNAYDAPHGNVFFRSAPPAPLRPGQDARSASDPRTSSNAPGPGEASAAPTPEPGLRPSLAAMLAPLRVRIRPVPDGAEGVIQPMRPVDALVPFTAGGDGGRTTLLFGAPGPAETSLAAIAADARIPLAETFGPNRVAVDDRSLGRLVAFPTVRIAAAVRIQGPVEASDAEFLGRAIDRDENPMAAEVRAERAFRVRDDQTLVVNARTARGVVGFVADSLRQYLAATLRVSADEVAPPDVGLLVPLIEESGELTVRPIETDVYSTAVDVGISTSPPESPRPARHSLIHDLHANTWHGE